MNKHICALLLFGMICLSACSLPVNKTSGEKAKKPAEPSVKIQKTESLKQQDSAGTKEMVKEKADIPKPEEKTNQQNLRITLYYQDEEGMVIPVGRKTEKQEGIAKTAIIALVDSSINREELEYFGVYPVLPAGTEVIGLNIKQGTATIDFNSKLLSYKDAAAERNIVSSVVYTLTEFKTIENVKIHINGKSPGKLKYNTDVSKPLNRQNVLINSERANLTDGMRKIDVYLYKYINKNEYALPVSVEFSNLKQEEVPSKIIELSGKRYFDGKVLSQFPSGTKLLKSSIEGNTLILDFNSEFIKYGGNTREAAILKQLQYSMGQIPGIDRIKILVEGKQEMLPEGTEIGEGVQLTSEVNLLNED